MQMITIKIRPFFHLKGILKTKELTIELPLGSTVLDLIEELTKKFGPSLKEILIDENTGKVRPYYRILLGGQDLHHSEDMDTILCDGDILSLFPPVAGGNGI
jgi:sulfur-carrier protein